MFPESLSNFQFFRIDFLKLTEFTFKGLDFAVLKKPSSKSHSTSSAIKENFE